MGKVQLQHNIYESNTHIKIDVNGKLFCNDYEYTVQMLLSNRISYFSLILIFLLHFILWLNTKKEL